MRVIDTAYKLLNVQPGEGRTVLLLIAYSLCMGVAVAVFYTCSTSLFLSSFPRSELPWAFVAGGLLVYGLGAGVQRLQRYTSSARLNAWLLGFLLVSVTALLLAPAEVYSRWVYFVLFLWNRVFVFINGVTFWATAAKLFNFEQAKRLFSFISLGDVISSILSYFSVPILLSFIPTHQLLFVTVFFLLLCAGLMIPILHRSRAASLLTRQHETTKNTPDATDAPAHRQTYYRLLNWLAFFVVFSLVYVEFMFTVEVREVFPNADVMASFLGIFLGFCAVIELLIRLFLYNRLLKTYSIRFAILVLPLSVLFCYSLASVYGTFYGATSLFFAFIALSRFFMSSVRKAITEPAFQVLQQPIPPTERSRVQRHIESVPKALGSITPGLLLLILNYIPAITTVHLSYIYVVFLLAGVWIALRIQPYYRAMLEQAVARSAALLRSQTMPANAPTEHTSAPNLPFDALVQLSQSDAAADRARAAEGLGLSGRYYAYIHLQRLLTDEELVVRQAALLGAGRLGKPELWPGLIAHLYHPNCRDTAVAGLLAVGERVLPALNRAMNQAGRSTREQVQLIEVVGQMSGDETLRFLRGRINHPVQAVRDAVFVGLQQQRYRVTAMERPHVLQQLDEQVSLLVWLAAVRLDLTTFPKDAPLIQALRDEKQRIVPTVFNRLATLYGDDRFDLISELITRKNDDVQGYLLELLGTSLPDELKNQILPLFADVPLAEKLRRCALNYPQQSLSVEERLYDIINKDVNKLTARTKALALFELLTHAQNDPTIVLVASTVSPDPLIAETALFVLKQLNPTRFAELYALLGHLPNGPALLLAERVASGLPADALQLWRTETSLLAPA